MGSLPVGIWCKSDVTYRRRPAGDSRLLPEEGASILIIIIIYAKALQGRFTTLFHIH